MPGNCQTRVRGIDFRVVDAKSGADLTRAILLQIILDEESGPTPMFSREMLTQIVRFHGAAQQTMVGAYVEENVNTLLRIQKKLQEQAASELRDAPAFTAELWKQLMQMQAPATQQMIGDFLEQSVRRFMAKL